MRYLLQLTLITAAALTQSVVHSQTCTTAIGSGQYVCPNPSPDSTTYCVSGSTGLAAGSSFSIPGSNNGQPTFSCTNGASAILYASQYEIEGGTGLISPTLTNTATGGSNLYQHTAATNCWSQENFGNIFSVQNFYASATCSQATCNLFYFLRFDCDPCHNVNCGSNGSCNESNGQCTCINGYTGASCQTTPTPAPTTTAAPATTSAPTTTAAPTTASNSATTTSESTTTSTGGPATTGSGTTSGPNNGFTGSASSNSSSKTGSAVGTGVSSWTVLGLGAAAAIVQAM